MILKGRGVQRDDSTWLMNYRWNLRWTAKDTEERERRLKRREKRLQEGIKQLEEANKQLQEGQKCLANNQRYSLTVLVA